MRPIFRYLCIFLLIFYNSSIAKEFLIVQSTTSTANTGLLEYLGDLFFEDTGIEIRAVAVGTGQAIKNSMRGDGDVLLVHDKIKELKFVKDGFGVKRHDLMYNDFIFVGPKTDPENIKKSKTVLEVIDKLSKGKTRFISRDDNSGTHSKELKLWKLSKARLSSDFYIKSGAGMASTINMAAEMQAYTITDRGSWISHNNKGSLALLYENDNLLFNPYGIIAINPKKFPNTKYNNAKKFIEWILSKKIQNLIELFKVNGEQIFFTYKVNK